MKVREVFQQIRQVRIPQKGYPVEETVAKELIGSLNINAEIKTVDPSDMKSEAGIVYIAVRTEDLTKLLL